MLFRKKKKRRGKKQIRGVTGGHSAAVLLCAGQGNRAGGSNKLLRPIIGKSALLRSLETLLSCEKIRMIAVVVSEETKKHAQHCIEMSGEMDRCMLVDGGNTRGESAYLGLTALNKQTAPSVVAIHDAARCLVSLELIEECLESARTYGSGVAGVPVVDTIRRVSDEGLVIGELFRDELWQVQTPQAFAFNTIMECYNEAFEMDQFGTDDASVLSSSGYEIHMVKASYDNIKITGPNDFSLAEFYLRQGTKSFGDFSRQQRFRIGFGEDTHRMSAGRKLIIGGVDIPHERGLAGHSDADVLAHAIMDALLGAAAMGDIGKLFPDYDIKYKDADSMKLMRLVSNMLRKRAYVPCNIDATIIADQPKLAAHIDAMCAHISNALDMPRTAVSVKATTNEGLGFIGREDGISARAVVLVLSE